MPSPGLSHNAELIEWESIAQALPLATRKAGASAILQALSPALDHGIHWVRLTLPDAHLCGAGQARQGFPMIPSHGDFVNGVILLLIVQRPTKGCAGSESLPTQLIICRQQ